MSMGNGPGLLTSPLTRSRPPQQGVPESTDRSDRIGRTPQQQVAERSAEGIGLGTAAAAVGLQDHQRMLASAAQRLREGHVASARAAGFGADVVPGIEPGG